MTGDCPFCVAQEQAPWQFGSVFAIPDRYPVTEGHLLVIPLVHRPDYFSMTDDELMDAQWLLARLRDELVRRDPTITGFNIGTNCGEDAGQTVPHAHIHLIPRRKGDTTDPGGGVRGVIPNRMHYEPTTTQATHPGAIPTPSPIG